MVIAKSAIVLYALDLKNLSGFYTGAFALDVLDSDDDYAQLGSGIFELTLIQAPADIVDRVHLETPARARAETPIKPVYFVEGSLNELRESIVRSGGHFAAPETEWRFGNYQVCDGHDTEGNIFQIRSKLDEQHTDT